LRLKSNGLEPDCQWASVAINASRCLKRRCRISIVKRDDIEVAANQMAGYDDLKRLRDAAFKNKIS